MEKGLRNYASNPAQKHMLMDMLEGLRSTPHAWPNLAAKGYNQYEYNAKKLNERNETNKQCIIYKAQSDNHQGNEFASLTEQLGNHLSLNRNIAQQHLAAPETTKALSEEDKQLVEWVKEISGVNKEFVKALDDGHKGIM